MRDNYKYATLICSLPAYDSLFASRNTPLSRIQLERRLKLLDEDDAHDLTILGEILDWFRHPLDRSDEELLSIIKVLSAQILSSSIRYYIEWRIEFRILIAALRQKHRGRRFAESSEWQGSWLGSRWVSYIVKHWNEPVFGLEKALPWLTEIKPLLESEQAEELEKHILMQVWRWLEKESFGHEFDLEAVAIYRMRWDLVARWTSYKKEAAEEKFTQFIDLALGDNYNEKSGCRNEI